MKSKIIELVLKYLGLPLLKHLIDNIYAWFKEKYDKYKTDREIDTDQTNRTREVEDAKTPDEIRASHRNNNRF